MSPIERVIEAARALLRRRDEVASLWQGSGGWPDIEGSCLREALAALDAAPKVEEELSKVETTLAFFRSAIISGEPWTQTCQDAFNDAKRILAAGFRRVGKDATEERGA